MFASHPRGDRLRIEFFDFINSRRCGRSWGFDFNLHQGFGEGFGVEYKWVACTFGLVFISELASLGIGVDGKEGTPGGDGGNEGAGAAFIPFEVAVGVIIIGLQDRIGDAGDFHNFRGKDVLVDRKI